MSASGILRGDDRFPGVPRKIGTYFESLGLLQMRANASIVYHSQVLEFGTNT